MTKYQMTLLGKPELITVSTDSDVRYTPEWLLDAVRAGHGAKMFDLDPCSDEIGNQLVDAAAYYDKELDGLDMPWFGSTWMNWPFSNPSPWMEKLIKEWNKTTDHPSLIVREVTVLARADFSTQWAQQACGFFDLICHPKERIKFIGAGDSPDFTCVLFYKNRDGCDHDWVQSMSKNVGQVFRSIR